MPVGDFPHMAAAAYQNSNYTGEQMLGSAAFISNSARQQDEALEQLAALKSLQRGGIIMPDRDYRHPSPTNQESIMPTRRIVQVYIADPCEDVPLKDAILYTGEQKMTDLTDQELFFEIDIKGVLEAHNAKRTKLVNKKVKDRTEYLEPAKVRDLKMVVVTVAGF